MNPREEAAAAYRAQFEGIYGSTEPTDCAQVNRVLYEYPDADELGIAQSLVDRRIGRCACALTEQGER